VRTWPSYPSHEVRTAWWLRRQSQPKENWMSRDQVSRRWRQLLERLSQPSSAAGLAALLALLVPQFAEHAPVLVDLAVLSEDVVHPG
jgi:hypothetical protein